MSSLLGEMRRALSMLDANQVARLWDLLCVLAYLYLLIECIFFAAFHLYLIPRANRRTAPQPYRDYGRNREGIMIRVLGRLRKTHGDEGFFKAVQEFVEGWFEPIDNVAVSSEARSPASKSIFISHSMSTAATVDDDQSLSSNEEIRKVTSTDRIAKSDVYTIQNIGRDEGDLFFAWALFEKEPHNGEDWEWALRNKMYERAENEYRVRFDQGSFHRFKPKRLSLEDVNSLWRPLAVYVFFWILSLVGAGILRLSGFQRVVSMKTGLTGWYRPSKTPHGDELLPLLFFHGIAPAGVFLYLPLVLCRLACDNRAVFLFDNPNISCRIGFDALREAETVEGVIEIVDKFLPDKSRKVSLCGHSFGSCPLTWLLHAPGMRDRIQQFVLLDPVTILLSEPDVMSNFLYNKRIDTIRVCAGSELFTEYYLRRHFAWYNSELWLEDIPESVQVLICLSQQDEIVNAAKVKKHVELFGKRAKLIVWEGARHAECVAIPSKWRGIKQAMLEQELALTKSK